MFKVINQTSAVDSDSAHLLCAVYICLGIWDGYKGQHKVESLLVYPFTCCSLIDQELNLGAPNMSPDHILVISV